MKFEDVKNQQVELYHIGGQIVSIEDMVKELRMHRRNNFLRRLLSIEEGKSNNFCTFDAIGFQAAVENFHRHFNMDGGNYEGTITYDVIAGSNWVWHCKTTITWVDTYPIAFGAFTYETTVVENEHVKMDRIYAVNGTGLQINVIKRDIKEVSTEEAFERSRRNSCK